MSRRAGGIYGADVLAADKPNICTCDSCCAVMPSRRKLRDRQRREVRQSIGRRRFVSHTS